jgi:hypothetical protein
VKKSKAERAVCKETKFVCHLEKATEKVQSWPEWKKNIFGELRSSCENKVSNTDYVKK